MGDSIGILENILTNQHIPFGKLNLTIKIADVGKIERVSPLVHEVFIIGYISHFCSVRNRDVKQLYTARLTELNIYFYMPKIDLVKSDEDNQIRGIASRFFFRQYSRNIVDESENINYHNKLSLEANCLCKIHEYINNSWSKMG